jgi:putative copper resistance protein D
MLPPFGWEAAVSRWQFAPVVTGSVILAAGLYLWGARRVARRHPARPWPAWRTAMFLGGLAVVVAATQSGIGTYDDVLFWDHMVQHLMLIMIAPPLLIAGQPVTPLLHATRNPLHTWAKRFVRSPAISFLTWPVLGALATARRCRCAPDGPGQPGADQRDAAQRGARGVPAGRLPVLPADSR